MRVIQRAGLRCMQPGKSRITGNDDIRVVAEPLDAATPDISMDIVIRSRRLQQEQNMPHNSQPQPDDNDALWETWRGEQLTHGEKVCNAGNCQRNDEGGSTQAAELA